VTSAALSVSSTGLEEAARQLRRVVVRDALTSGVDWWTLGGQLDLHPQAAFNQYANLVDGSHGRPTRGVRVRPADTSTLPPDWHVRGTSSPTPTTPATF
jgi:hypothetical protein